MFMSKILLWSFFSVLAMVISGCANEFYRLELEQPLLNVPLFKGDRAIIETNSADIYDIRVTSNDTASKIIEGRVVSDYVVERRLVRIGYEDISSIKRQSEVQRSGNSSRAGEFAIKLGAMLFLCILTLFLACM